MRKGSCSTAQTCIIDAIVFEVDSIRVFQLFNRCTIICCSSCQGNRTFAIVKYIDNGISTRTKYRIYGIGQFDDLQIGIDAYVGIFYIGTPIDDGPCSQYFFACSIYKGKMLVFVGDGIRLQASSVTLG